MSKKSQNMKQRLGSMLKRARRLPVMARLRTHRRLEQNLFGRNWRRTKMRLSA